MNRPHMVRVDLHPSRPITPADDARMAELDALCRSPWVDVKQDRIPQDWRDRGPGQKDAPPRYSVSRKGAGSGRKPAPYAVAPERRCCCCGCLCRRIACLRCGHVICAEACVYPRKHRRTKQVARQLLEERCGK